MAIPLTAVLAAAPGIISAAADIIKVIRDRKQKPLAEDGKLDELESLIEQQALLIEELAISNRNMAMAVRNNRMLSMIALGLAIVTFVLAFARS